MSNAIVAGKHEIVAVPTTSLLTHTKFPKARWALEERLIARCQDTYTADHQRYSNIFLTALARGLVVAKQHGNVLLRGQEEGIIASCVETVKVARDKDPDEFYRDREGKVRQAAELLLRQRKLASEIMEGLIKERFDGLNSMTPEDRAEEEKKKGVYEEVMVGMLDDAKAVFEEIIKGNGPASQKAA